MPVLEDNEQETPGQSLAVWAETLYLANLLLAPGLAFLILLWLYFKRSANMPALALCHLRQALSASVWAGTLLVIANLLIILLGGYAAPNTWVIVIIYFTTCHSTLVLLGVLGLAKAMAGQKYVYPLVGRPCD
ncbi:MAG: hypothetical protein KKD65_11250 [Gammaproteobacteria bacterium]|nr:hypothetical protein [Gammaproteobacteria bacterium]